MLNVMKFFSKRILLKILLLTILCFPHFTCLSEDSIKDNATTENLQAELTEEEVDQQDNNLEDETEEKPLDTEKENKETIIKKCLEENSKDSLTVGWHEFIPYQYQVLKKDKLQLVGLDIAIINYLAKKTGYNLTFKNDEWDVQQNHIKNGSLDVTLGATYNEKRSEYAYFSLPYRQEEDALFIKSDNNNLSSFKNIEELLTQIRLQNFRIGIIKQNIYTNNVVNDFLNSINNADIVKSYTNVPECINALNKGEIDGFLGERVFSSYMLISDIYNFKPIIIPGKTPLHIMFNKKTVPLNIIDRFNKEIKDFIGTKTYTSMIKNYLYSNLFIQILHAKWFLILSIAGTIGFALSGFAIATKEGLTIFKSCLVAIIPSLLGIILKDLFIDASKDGNNFSIEHLFFFLSTIGIFYILILILQYINRKNQYPDNSVVDFLSTVAVIGDSLGKSCFFPIGISVALILQVNPIIIIPIAGVIVGHLGLAIRNLMTFKRIHSSNELNVEITLFWSCFLTFYLHYYYFQLDASKIEFIIFLTIIGSFITRLIVYYLKIPNIKLDLFKKENIDN
jgi:polar amino acid transport system substrate-binding protein